MDLELTNEVLEIVSTSFTNDYRTLACLKEKREAHPETAETLDPLIQKFKELCAHLEKLKSDLRMAAVASRT